MFDKLGAVGVFGVLCLLAGVVVVAMESLLIAAGIALVIAGLGFVVLGMVKNLMSAMGLDGMM